MSFGTIVVGVDGSSNGAEALAFAAELARAAGAPLTAVHVFEPLAWIGRAEPPVDFAALRDQVAQVLRQDWCGAVVASGVDVQTLVVEGRPNEALIGVADDCDAALIVVGLRGHSLVRDLVAGSTSTALPRESHRPVVLVPPTD